MNIFTLKTFTIVNATKMLLVSVKNSNNGSSFFLFLCEIMFFVKQTSPNKGRSHFTLNIWLFSINKHTKTQINWEITSSLNAINGQQEMGAVNV